MPFSQLIDRLRPPAGAGLSARAAFPTLRTGTGRAEVDGAETFETFVGHWPTPEEQHSKSRVLIPVLAGSRG
jgi:hypothetical protein